MVEVESDIEQDNSNDNAQCPQQQHLSATPNFPGLIWPTRNSKRPAKKVLVMVNAMETRRNKGVKKM